MNYPRRKRVLFMSISAAPAHRDQNFEVSPPLFHSPSSAREDDELRTFFAAFFVSNPTHLFLPVPEHISSGAGIMRSRSHQDVHDYRPTTNPGPARIDRSHHESELGAPIVVSAPRRFGGEVWWWSLDRLNAYPFAR